MLKKSIAPFDWYSESLFNYYQNVYQRNNLVVALGGVAVQGDFYLLHGLVPMEEEEFYELPLCAVRSDPHSDQLTLDHKVAIRLTIDDYNRISKTLDQSRVQITDEIFEYIDLTEEPAKLKKSLRKSYKSLVNKADDVVVVDASADLDRIISECKRLHFLVAEKKTRSDDSWTAMARAVENQEAVLVVKYLGGRLVGYCFFFNNQVNAYYASSVMEARKGAHPLIWQGIMALKERGVERLIMNVSEVGEHKSEKELSITSFKRGFGLLEMNVKKVSFF